MLPSTRACKRFATNRLAVFSPSETLMRWHRNRVRPRLFLTPSGSARCSHARGLRRTAPRIAVLATLELVDGHLSVAEIHRRLLESNPADGPPPDLATVYRTVTTLVELGVLHALSVEGGVSTYGLAEEPHHHAVCTRCGAIIEVPAQRLRSALEGTRQRGQLIHPVRPGRPHAARPVPEVPRALTALRLFGRR